jgi:hypothetical protein
MIHRNFMSLNMKIARRTLIIVAFLILVLLGIGIYIPVTYENTAIKYLKKYLDNHLITEIEVDDISFSLLKSFPYASIRFKNVYAKSALNFAVHDFAGRNIDTLLTANNIFFEFGILKLLSGKYEIRNININNGELKILIDNDGKANYNIWESGQKKHSKDFYMNLQSMIFSDIDIHLINLKDRYTVSAYNKKLVIKGNLSDTLNNLLVKGNLHIADFSVNNRLLLGDKELYFESNLLNKDDNYKIRKGKIRLGSVSLNVRGDILYGQPPEITLNISSGKAKLSDILSLFHNKPEFLPGFFSVSGNAYFNAKIYGKLSQAFPPDIVAAFHVTNATLLNKKSREKLSGIRLKGTYTNGEKNNPGTTKIYINDFYASARNSIVNGKLSINNTKQPQFRLILNANIDLNEMQNFINIDTLEYLNGNLNAKIDITGMIPDVKKITKRDFIGFTKDCILNFSGANFKITGTGLIINTINGKVFIRDNIKLDNLSLSVGSNTLLIDGILDNFFEFALLRNKYMQLNADISSDIISIKTPIANKLRDNSGKEESASILPSNLLVNANVYIKKMSIDKFEASNISGVINYRPGIINFNIKQLKSFDGSITGHGMVTEKEDNYFIQCQSNLNLLDITRFFYSFNNFGQNFIVDKNLKGHLSGDVIFSSVVDKKSGFLKETIKADGNLKIENGELIQFEPMMGLSRYIALEELNHIKFKTLSNEILIRNQIITIPEMDIYSSAINITALGIHKFDNSYDYRIKVSMTDLLFNKARKKRKEITDFGIIEDDGLGKISVPLKFIGKGDKYEITFDKKAALGTLKNNIQNEKKVLGNIFREEFNNSHEDNNLKEKEMNSKNIDYNISWEEQYDKKDAIFEKEDLNKDHSPEYIIEWDENEDTLDRKND